jgi:hypothetical protein
MDILLFIWGYSPLWALASLITAFQLPLSCAFFHQAVTFKILRSWNTSSNHLNFRRHFFLLQAVWIELIYSLQNITLQYSIWKKEVSEMALCYVWEWSSLGRSETYAPKIDIQFGLQHCFGKFQGLKYYWVKECFASGRHLDFNCKNVV